MFVSDISPFKERCVSECGLIVHPELPHLGSSIATYRIQFCFCCGKRVVKVKSLFAKRSMLPHIAAADYIYEEDGIYKLIYKQIQKCKKKWLCPELNMQILSFTPEICHRSVTYRCLGLYGHGFYPVWPSWVLPSSVFFNYVWIWFIPSFIKSVDTWVLYCKISERAFLGLVPFLTKPPLHFDAVIRGAQWSNHNWQFDCSQVPLSTDSTSSSVIKSCFFILSKQSFISDEEAGCSLGGLMMLAMALDLWALE